MSAQLILIIAVVIVMAAVGVGVTWFRLTICLLIRGSDRDAVDLQAPGTGSDFLWRSSTYGVNAEGTITSHIDVPESTPFCLVPWLPPADYRGPLTIIERATDKRYAYDLRSESIIRTNVTRVDADE